VEGKMKLQYVDPVIDLLRHAKAFEKCRCQRHATKRGDRGTFIDLEVQPRQTGHTT